MPLSRNELREELLAITRARSELPADSEQYLIERFLDNLDREIDGRIEAKIGARPQRSHNRTAIACTALVMAIPLSLISVFAGWHGLLVTWVAILLVVFLATRN
jgi:hypothetical protein